MLYIWLILSSLWLMHLLEECSNMSQQMHTSEFDHWIDVPCGTRHCNSELIPAKNDIEPFTPMHLKHHFLLHLSWSYWVTIINSKLTCNWPHLTNHLNKLSAYPCYHWENCNSGRSGLDFNRPSPVPTSSFNVCAHLTQVLSWCQDL